MDGCTTIQPDPHGPVGKFDQCAFCLARSCSNAVVGRWPRPRHCRPRRWSTHRGALAKLTQTANNCTMVCMEEFQPADFANVVGLSLVHGPSRCLARDNR